MRTVSKKLAAIGAACAALGGVAALAHVPSVRAALGVAACPMGGGAPSPEALEQMRVKSVASLRTGRSAAARPALGFVLGASTRADAKAWASKNGLVCNDELGGAALRCEGGGEIRDAFFRFAPSGALVAVDASHAPTPPERACETAKTLADAIAREAGAAAHVRGEPTAAHLGGGRYNQFAAEFRFSDYAADVVATNLGDVVVREQYRMLDRAPN